MKVIQSLSRACTTVAFLVPLAPLLGGCTPGLHRSKETAVNSRYGVLVVPVNGGVGMRLLDSSLFDADDSSVRPDSGPALDRTAELLKRSTRPILIEGHTDNDGTLAYNDALSKARAESVAQALIARGVPAARIKTMGLGPMRPVASNDTAQGRAMNRRVDILVKAESAETILGR